MVSFHRFIIENLEFEGKIVYSDTTCLFTKAGARWKAKECKCVYFLGYNTNPHIETRTIAGGRLRRC